MKRFLNLFVLITFCFSSLNSYPVFAAPVNLPQPGTMLTKSEQFAPVTLRGLKFDRQNPFKLSFILDEGNTKLTDAQLKETSKTLIRYFLAALTTPGQDMWVNLSPYEQDRILPESFAATDLGNDMLAQDYLLKQLASSLTYPETELGKKYWQSINGVGANNHSPAAQSFNKVWITPNETQVYETGDKVFITKSSIKILSDQDYLAMQQNSVGANNHSPAGQAFKTLIIPAIEKEVNTGKNFANFRQLHSAVILAAWFKNRLKDSIYQQLYIDKNKTAGIDANDPKAKEKIFVQYVEAFKKGAYNYIKKERVSANGDGSLARMVDGKRTVPIFGRKITKRAYFSGGASEAVLDQPPVVTLRTDLPCAEGLQVVTAPPQAVSPALMRVEAGQMDIISAVLAPFGENALTGDAEMNANTKRALFQKKAVALYGDLREALRQIDTRKPIEPAQLAVYQEKANAIADILYHNQISPWEIPEFYATLAGLYVLGALFSRHPDAQISDREMDQFRWEVRYDEKNRQQALRVVLAAMLQGDSGQRLSGKIFEKLYQSTEEPQITAQAAMLNPSLIAVFWQDIEQLPWSSSESSVIVRLRYSFEALSHFLLSPDVPGEEMSSARKNIKILLRGFNHIAFERDQDASLMAMRGLLAKAVGKVMASMEPIEQAQTRAMIANQSSIRHDTAAVIFAECARIAGKPLAEADRETVTSEALKEIEQRVKALGESLRAAPQAEAIEPAKLAVCQREAGEIGEIILRNGIYPWTRALNLTGSLAGLHVLTQLFTRYRDARVSENDLGMIAPARMYGGDVSREALRGLYAAILQSDSGERLGRQILEKLIKNEEYPDVAAQAVMLNPQLSERLWDEALQSTRQDSRFNIGTFCYRFEILSRLLSDSALKSRAMAMARGDIELLAHGFDSFRTEERESGRLMAMRRLLCAAIGKVMASMKPRNRPIAFAMIAHHPGISYPEIEAISQAYQKQIDWLQGKDSGAAGDVDPDQRLRLSSDQPVWLFADAIRVFLEPQESPEKRKEAGTWLLTKYLPVSLTPDQARTLYRMVNENHIDKDNIYGQAQELLQTHMASGWIPLEIILTDGDTHTDNTRGSVLTVDVDSKVASQGIIRDGILNALAHALKKNTTLILSPKVRQTLEALRQNPLGDQSKILGEILAQDDKNIAALPKPGSNQAIEIAIRDAATAFEKSMGAEDGVTEAGINQHEAAVRIVEALSHRREGGTLQNAAFAVSFLNLSGKDARKDPFSRACAQIAGYLEAYNGMVPASSVDGEFDAAVQRAAVFTSREAINEAVAKARAALGSDAIGQDSAVQIITNARLGQAEAKPAAAPAAKAEVITLLTRAVLRAEDFWKKFPGQHRQAAAQVVFALHYEGIQQELGSDLLARVLFILDLDDHGIFSDDQFIAACAQIGKHLKLSNGMVPFEDAEFDTAMKTALERVREEHLITNSGDAALGETVDPAFWKSVEDPSALLGAGDDADFTISVKGSKNTKRFQHEKTNERIKAIVYQIAIELGMRNAAAGIIDYEYDLYAYVMQHGVMRGKERYVTTSHGELRITEDGILVIVDDRFKPEDDRAGRDRLCVYVHSKSKIPHELYELRAWMRVAQKMKEAGLIPGYDGQLLGTYLRGWLNQDRSEWDEWKQEEENGQLYKILVKMDAAMNLQDQFIPSEITEMAPKGNFHRVFIQKLEEKFHQEACKEEPPELHGNPARELDFIIAGNGPAAKATKRALSLMPSAPKKSLPGLIAEMHTALENGAIFNSSAVAEARDALLQASTFDALTDEIYKLLTSGKVDLEKDDFVAKAIVEALALAAKHTRRDLSLPEGLSRLVEAARSASQVDEVSPGIDASAVIKVLNPGSAIKAQASFAIFCDKIAAMAQDGQDNSGALSLKSVAIEAMQQAGTALRKKAKIATRSGSSDGAQRDEQGRFKNHPGKSPQDAARLVLRAEELQTGNFTLEKFLESYRKYGKELGYEDLAKNPESTASRDLEALVESGILGKIPVFTPGGKQNYYYVNDQAKLKTFGGINEKELENSLSIKVEGDGTRVPLFKNVPLRVDNFPGFDFTIDAIKRNQTVAQIVL